MRVRALIRRRRRLRARVGPRIRPVALAAPIAVLLICLPLLRPLRHSEPAADEALRLATIQNLLDHRTLALAPGAIGALAHSDRVVHINGRIYASQAPTMSVLLVGPTWLIRKMGWDLRTDPEAVAYALTLLAVTLPVAGAAGLLYRMARLFELSRRWRLLLALTCVAGSGLLSYAVVLNAHAPAAALLIAAAACLIHVEASQRPRRAAGWIVLAGFCAALAMALDLIAAMIGIPLALVIITTRFSLRFRLGGVLLLILGALPVLAVHAAFNLPVTGDLVPLPLHLSLHEPVPSQSIARSASAPLPEEDADDIIAPSGAPSGLVSTCQWLTTALVGSHGLLSHFPILLLGVGGVGAVMHRHWPAPVKVLAGTSLAGTTAAMVLFCWMRRDWRDADFAISWLVTLLPLVMFWGGAWARRSHSKLGWTLAGVLLSWSIMVSLLGATDPVPAEGYDNFTAAQALIRLIRPPQIVPDVIAGR
jgi:hypothetical protein